MNKRILRVCAGLFLVLMHTGSAYAACWNIELRDATQIRATDFWNLSSKLEESPQSFLIGQVDGEEQQIQVRNIQSIVYQAKEAHGWNRWLKGGNAIAQISFSDGTISTLETDLPVFYRTVGEKKHLPASTVMGERADNRDMNLNIFYRAKGDVKQLPVKSISRIERCKEVPETPGESEVIVQQVERIDSPHKAVVQGNSDVLGMVNGDTLTGRLTTTPIRWQTDYGVLEINRADIRSLDIVEDSNRQGKLELLSGDHINGRLLNKTLTIHLTIGQSLDIPAAKLRTLTLHETVKQE